MYKLLKFLDVDVSDELLLVLDGGCEVEEFKDLMRGWNPPYFQKFLSIFNLHPILYFIPQLTPTRKNIKPGNQFNTVKYSHKKNIS